jgi:glyoxylase-like metal-dependent hydrolase (beta-lactamase superfamily II)
MYGMMKPSPDSHPLAAEAAGLVHPWPEPPVGGTAFDVAPGIQWIRMPLPFALDHINLWLLEDEGGVTVVDTGVGLPATRDLWESLFADALKERPIVRVLVTHFHPDHMGNAEWLARRFGVELWCPQAEWLMAQLGWQGMGGNDAEKRMSHYRQHGVGDAQIEAFRRRGNHYRQLVPTVAAQFRAVRDGDVLSIGGRRWHAFTVLGHAPEHACLHCPEAGVLISGDQVLPKITTNVSVWPDQPRGNPLRLYLDSLGRFRPLPAEILVLPSHGLPFRGLHLRLDHLRLHHDERLAETVDALAEPRTAAELVPVLFRRRLDTHQLGFAIGETLAHLHYLEAEGQVARLVDATGVHRFHKA